MRAGIVGVKLFRTLYAHAAKFIFIIIAQPCNPRHVLDVHIDEIISQLFRVLNVLVFFPLLYIIEHVGASPLSIFLNEGLDFRIFFVETERTGTRDRNDVFWTYVRIFGAWGRLFGVVVRWWIGRFHWWLKLDGSVSARHRP